LAPAALLIAGVYGAIWFCPNIYQIFGPASPALANPKEKAPAWLSWRPTPIWAAAVGVIGVLAILAIGRASQFLYFQF
jgi:hypothetical protein